MSRWRPPLFVLALIGCAFTLFIGCGKKKKSDDPSEDTPGFSQADKRRSINNLKQIGLGLHSYHDSMGRLPAGYTTINGQPAWSWRVQILPFVEESDLYNRLDLKLPPSHPKNKALLGQTPKVFRLPGVSKDGDETTYYRVFLSSKTATLHTPFGPDSQTRIFDVTDGTSNTLAVVEAADPVTWYSPDDLVYDEDGQLPKLGAHYGVCNVAFLDGSVRSIRSDTPERTLRLLATMDDGQIVPNDFEPGTKPVANNDGQGGGNPVQKVREAAVRTQSQNNLKQIGLAMHSYHDAYQGFPTAAIFDKTGKPLLSWRVAILPFIEQQTLYSQFKLDEPWNSAHNIKLLPLMPKTYLQPGTGKPGDTTTHYRVFVQDPTDTKFEQASVFDWTKPFNQAPQLRPIASITDGTSNTLLVAEAEGSVPWTKPDELMFHSARPLPKLGYFHNGRCNAVSADGAVHTLDSATSEKKLRALISRAGNEIQDW